MRTVEQMRRTILGGLAAFRWLAWAWMAAVLWLARGSLAAPRTAVLLVLAAGVVTLVLTWLLATAPERLLSARTVGVEVGTGVALQLADGFVYTSPHVFTAAQPLGVAWPIAGAMAAGVAAGPFTGALTGVMLGVARAVSSIAVVTPAVEPWIGPLDPQQGLSLVTSTVLYTLAGGVAGSTMRLLVRAEERLARAERTVAGLEARQEVARELHDGVLQTLAIVSRRSGDADLARLARDQERDLRRYLQDPDPGRGGVATDLGTALRQVADRAEARSRIRTEVLVPGDLPPLDATVVEALAGAVGEALTNVAKHAGASRVVIYAEPEDAEPEDAGPEDAGPDAEAGTGAPGGPRPGVWVSVRDDGVGYDPAQVREGLGLTRSIRGRLGVVGGQVEIVTAPDRGVEVRLWAPITPS